jgi:hypothetical protein
MSKGETSFAPSAALAAAVAELRRVYNLARVFPGVGNQLNIELQPPEMHETSGQHAYEAILARHGLMAHGFVQAPPYKSRFLRNIIPIRTGDMNVAPLDTAIATPVATSHLPLATGGLE